MTSAIRISDTTRQLTVDDLDRRISLSVAEAAQLLGIRNRKTIYDMIACGDLKARKRMSKRTQRSQWMISPQSVKALMA
ncbi:helix-turn-helix domain-containing protein [Bifidobacterium sp. 82T24]|uniref:helix-turn-helix domain-containing protein n=1 Tax=Bifidobacterium pluvialisilvae TaxID=2834436 RepID=UPI001C587274|nr:helix-turn-helix domain-containing protein [Bifidobacterium pluvialisilvae]MBW3088796.1 helix-turn-helix domain-containing protein [Bifidobacterium pluvialisilvae]